VHGGGFSVEVGAGRPPDAYFQQVRAAMLSHGRNDGAPPGQQLHGTTLNKNGVAANMGLFVERLCG
jgi:hypothetical protein